MVEGGGNWSCIDVFVSCFHTPLRKFGKGTLDLDRSTASPLDLI